MLTAVLRSALALGMKPSQATLRAMLACCKTLETGPGKTPMGLATGSGFSLQGLGYVDLGHVITACEEAVQQQEQYSSTGSTLAAAAAAKHSSSSSTNAEQLAAELLRTWAFNSTFDYVNGVMKNGPMWALHHAPAASNIEAATSAAVGM